jgi:hypothetical protein
MFFLKNRIFFIILLIFFISSCSTWSNKEWENLQDKNFHFQKFMYSQKGINSKKAFEEIKNFPADKVLKVIAHKYNINIDTSEYEEFLAYEDISNLAVTGFLNENYTWENKNKNTNVIELEYRRDFLNREQYNKIRFYIFINVNGKTRTEFLGELTEKVPFLLTIAKSMDYSRVDKNSDSSYVNNETKAVVDLTTGVFKNIPRDAKAGQEVKIGKDYPDKMKNDIREYIKSLSPADRKKFRDDTIKYLYKVIE